MDWFKHLDKKAIWESTKEFLRLAIFAAVGAAVTAILNAALLFVAGLNLDPTINGIIVAWLTAMLRAWDKYIHESRNTTAKGLVSF